VPCHLYERLRDKGAEEGRPLPQRNTGVGAFGDFARAVGVSRARGRGTAWASRPPTVGVMASRSGRDAHPTGQSPCDFYFPSSAANGPSPYTALPPTIVSTECKSPTCSTGTVR